MTRFRAIRTAWAATLAGCISAVAYFTLMPMTMSATVDIVASISFVAVGAVLGGLGQRLLEDTLSAIRTEATSESIPLTDRSLARV